MIANCLLPLKITRNRLSRFFGDAANFGLGHKLQSTSILPEIRSLSEIPKDLEEDSCFITTELGHMKHALDFLCIMTNKMQESSVSEMFALY
jgi:hypothetical protein